MKQNLDGINISNHDTSASESESESDGDTMANDDLEDEVDEWVFVSSNKNLPKVNATIECKFPNYETIIKCRIISKGGKSSTSSWHFLNIQGYGEDHGKCCSFKNVF